MTKIIKIKPNDQSLVGKQFKNSCDVLVRIIAVGGEKVFFKYEEPGTNIETTFQIDFFNKTYSLVEEPHTDEEASDEKEIDWSGVKWARDKETGKIYKIDEGMEYQLIWVYNNFFEPIKFTQILKVGDVIRRMPHFEDEYTVDKVNDDFFEVRLNSDYLNITRRILHSDDWELVNKTDEFVSNANSIDTKKKLLAPAFYKPKHELEWHFSKDSGSYYSSKEDAQKHFGDDHEVIWPAIPNKDGWYEIDTKAKDCKKKQA